VLILLPIGAFAAIYLVVLGWAKALSETGRSGGARRGLGGLGCALVLGMEASLGRAISSSPLAGYGSR
jgi:hypothetical protein